MKALAYLTGGLAITTLYALLATVLAIDLALLGIIDGGATLRFLMPVALAFLRILAFADGALASIATGSEASAVQVLFLEPV